jgi:hypothetical protein
MIAGFAACRVDRSAPQEAQWHESQDIHEDIETLGRF